MACLNKKGDILLFRISECPLFTLPFTIQVERNFVQEKKLPEEPEIVLELRIWIDADACPRPIKDFLFKTSRKRAVKLVLVANQTMNAPENPLISIVTVPHGADKADDRIIDQIQPGDIVVTQDIPLAARAVEKECIAIGVHGELLDESSIGHRLATRNLMDQMRSAGMETRGPRPFDAKNLQSFANQLDRLLTRARRRQDSR